MVRVGQLVLALVADAASVKVQLAARLLSSPAAAGTAAARATPALMKKSNVELKKCMAKRIPAMMWESLEWMAEIIYKRMEYIQQTSVVEE